MLNIYVVCAHAMVKGVDDPKLLWGIKKPHKFNKKTLVKNVFNSPFLIRNARSFVVVYVQNIHVALAFSVKSLGKYLLFQTKFEEK